MALSASEVEKIKQAPAVEGVLPVVLKRWSVRSYANREVSLADLAKIFEAARWAASARNEQPWRYIVGLRNTETYKKIFDSLFEFNRPWAVTAPVLVLGLMTTTFTPDGSKNSFNFYDLGAAGANIALQATEMGMAVRTVASFDRDAVRKAFGIPSEIEIGTVLVLGYPGEPGALPSQQLIDMESSPRTRKSLDELVFSEWNKPLKLA
jgi:nitroreductase